MNIQYLTYVWALYVDKRAVPCVRAAVDGRADGGRRVDAAAAAEG